MKGLVTKRSCLAFSRMMAYCTPSFDILPVKPLSLINIGFQFHFNTEMKKCGRIGECKVIEKLEIIFIHDISL